MPVNEQIISLLKNEYANFDIFPDKIESIATFKCDCQSKCQVNLSKEASYTPLLGDEGSKYMIVAESPSTSQGKGCFLGGRSQNTVPTKRNDNIKSFLEYVRGINDGKYPYFTDIVKCGLEQTQSKGKLTFRKRNCIEKYLIKEIQIVNPQTIICLGSFAYNEIMTLIKNNKIDASIKVVQIMHYSNRASLTMSIEDKMKIIWPMELDLLTVSEAKEAILQLKHLVRKVDNLKD